MKKKRPNWVPVVTALIRKNGKLLVGLRPMGNSMAGVWEFPGGKVEPGEEPVNALYRELEEELGIKADVGDLKFISSHRYGETNLLLMFFEVFYWKGELKPVHHEELKWVSLAELPLLDLPEANRAVLPRIYKALT